jgi:predicted Zn-dependent protease
VNGPADLDDPPFIGPYRVIRRLGAGGMGEVFLAHDPRLDRPVAIKRIRGAGDPARRARFLREARLTAALRHPAIVQVFDLVSEGGDDHIVMEHIAGPTLRERLREEGPLRPAQGLPIAIAVADGLACAHRHGVVHRDLKSENVLLAPGGQPRIADFGIARRPPGPAGAPENDTLTDAGAVLGTYRVMSPEQARGEPTDARSDLFAFGVLLYEMFTGQSPFLADNGLATLQRVLHHRPPPASGINPGVPGELSELIDHLLEKQPLLRPRDAEEVAQRLRALASGVDDGEATWLPGTTPGPPPGPRKRTGTKALRPVLLAVALLLGLALAISLALRLRPAPPPLYVAVLAPRLQGPAGEDGDFLAFAVRGALHGGLTAFEGVFPKGLGEVDAVSGRPAEVARAVAADEVLEPTLACQGGSCKVAVSRLRGADGAATWSGSVEIPRAEPLTAARALAVLLRQAYPERRLRSGVPALRATPADYSEYLAVLRSATGEQRGADGAELLARLAEVRRRSPEFVEAYRLAATIEITGFKSRSRDPAGIDRALRLLAQARGLAPGDPDVRFSSAYAELLAERLDKGEAALAAFETAAPGDVRVLDLRSMLAERRGRPAEALAASRAAVERQPSWPRLYEHAKLARRQGEIAEARRSLNLLLSRFPGNPWGRQLLAVLELTNGDPARAAALYEELAARSPGPAEPGLLVNLGLARMLLGDYPAAAAALEKAVKAEPKNDFYLLNLAQARWLEGRRAEGETLCRRVLALSDPAGQEWQRLTVRAQALAQLGAREDAVAAAQEALALAPRSGQAAFEASLVYTLVGDRTAALVNARRAVQLGFDAPAWFRLPWFEPLRTDPGFRRLMSAR